MAPVDIVCITMFDAYNDKVHEYRNTNIDNQRTFVLLMFIASSVRLKETSVTRRKRALISNASAHDNLKSISLHILL